MRPSTLGLDLLCVLCDSLTGIGDDSSIFDVCGVVCGNCTRGIGLTPLDVLPCVLCGWPSLDHSENENGLICRNCANQQ